MRKVMSPCPVFREDDDHAECTTCSAKRYIVVTLPGKARPIKIATGPPAPVVSPGPLKPSRPPRNAESHWRGDPAQTAPSSWKVGGEGAKTKAQHERPRAKRRPGQAYRLLRLRRGDRCAGCHKHLSAGTWAYHRPGEVRHRKCIPLEARPMQSRDAASREARKQRRAGQARDQVIAMYEANPERRVGPHATLRLVRSQT